MAAPTPKPAFDMPLYLIAARLARRIKRYRVRALIGFAATVLIGGAAAFSIADHVSFGLALYWAVTTATTVGYGDVTPQNTASRVVAAAVMLGTIPAVGAVFALAAGASVVSGMRRILGMDKNLPASDFTVIYGSHPVLSGVLDELSRNDEDIVLVAASRPVDLPDRGHYLAGDPTDEAVIRSSHPERAGRALIACEQDSDALVVAVSIHSIAPQLEVYALTHSKNVARALSELGVAHTLSGEELIGHTLAKSLETPRAGAVLLSLVDSSSYRMVESAVTPDLVSQPLSAARGGADNLVLGLYRDGKVDLGVNDDPVLSAEDRLILVKPAG
jgi:voltage-gated potassium channel